MNFVYTSKRVFPGSSASKKICLERRRPWFDSWVEKIPWRKDRLPTPVFLPGEFHEQRSLAGYSPWGRKDLDLTEWLSTAQHSIQVQSKNVSVSFSMWISIHSSAVCWINLSFSVELLCTFGEVKRPHERINFWISFWSIDWFVSVSSLQSLSRVQLFVIPWIAACQASLSITNSRSSRKLTSIESVMPTSHLILCHPLLLLPPIPPSIRVFCNESTLRNRWPK